MIACKCGCGKILKTGGVSGFASGHYIRSSETKRKQSLAKLGKSLWPRGRKFGPDFGLKVSAGCKGKPWSKKKREVLSGRWTRRIHPMKGRHHSKGTKELLSKSKAKLITSGLFVPYNKSSGTFWSEKNGKLLSYRSAHEEGAFHLLEQLGKVARYLVEPLAIEYEFEGDRRRYIPDILVVYRDGSLELVEIKPSSRIGDPINQAKFAAARKFCEENRMEFSVWTERDIRA